MAATRQHLRASKTACLNDDDIFDGVFCKYMKPFRKLPVTARGRRRQKRKVSKEQRFARPQPEKTVEVAGDEAKAVKRQEASAKNSKKQQKAKAKKKAHLRKLLTALVDAMCERYVPHEPEPGSEAQGADEHVSDDTDDNDDNDDPLKAHDLFSKLMKVCSANQLKSAKIRKQAKQGTFEGCGCEPVRELLRAYQGWQGLDRKADCYAVIPSTEACIMMSSEAGREELIQTWLDRLC